LYVDYHFASFIIIIKSIFMVYYVGPLQDLNSPQCQRLLSRHVPFAMLNAEQIAKLKGGDCVELDSKHVSIVMAG